MTKNNNLFIEGLPISSELKLKIAVTTLLIILINHTMPAFSSILDYPGRDIVSIVMLGVMVLFSIGSVTAESFVLAMTLFGIFSNVWDFTVFDVSEWRKTVLIGSVFLVFIISMLGKVSIYNLTTVVMGQLGIGRRK